MTREALPFSRVDGIALLDDLAIDGEKEPKGVLGHRRVVDSRTERDGDFQCGRRGDVHFVESDAVFGHDLEARQGFFQDGARDGVVAAKQRVKIPGQLEHARFVERTALADDFVAFLRQQIVVRTGRVLERCRGEENFGHVKTGEIRKRQISFTTLVHPPPAAEGNKCSTAAGMV